MLTFDVKRKINTLRDILVGKVPDPKAQVEQITIALIYKFMDDMDIEGLEFGGTRQFFTGEYEKYAWTEIMKPENSGQQRAFTFKFLRGRISDMVSLLSGRDFDTCEYQKAIAENSFAKLKEGILEFVCKTDFQCYLMIVKSTSIISPATIRSQNVLNFGYALYLLLRSKGEDAAIIEKVVRWWMVLTILTGRYSESP